MLNLDTCPTSVWGLDAEGRVPMRRRIVWVMALLWGLSCLFAGSVGFVGGFRCQQSQASAAKPCENAQSTAEMLDCWDNQYKKADAELNKVYKEIMSRLGDKEKVKLRDAQRAWIPYKRKRAKRRRHSMRAEHSLRLPIMALTEETQNRVADLKRTYAMSCLMKFSQPPNQKPSPPHRPSPCATARQDFR